MRVDMVDVPEMRNLLEDQLRLSQRLRARIRELEEARHAPIAVVGMGLRFPREIDSPEDYWDFLRGEGTALSEIPEDRPGLRSVYDPVAGRPGRSYVDRGGFISDIAGFDAEFFGISHREAKQLDPQQRMLLETAWEALERAGVAVRRSDRLDVGVYLGMMASEYSERLEDPTRARISPYYTTGGGLCFGAGRISYVMGFSGPVVSVDTACSSSLTALHLAVRGLRDGDCRYALVCGSNLLLSANLMVSLCQTGALSPDGRSKSFLASADGYGRAEGVGAVLLMRLGEAERGGHPILAVVRGTAANHDGAASGLTAPSGPAQQEVIRAALADAGVDPADLGWIEAHGTGTVLGDPIEVGALDGAVGTAIRKRDTPLALGSVKSRLNHMEAASGIASLMKTVLMLRHAEIPAAVDDEDGDLNPHIPWDRLQFTVPRRNQPWPRSLPRRIAGVNSFGMSGTNVHVVLEAYEQGEHASPAEGTRRELLTLSAKHPEALADLAKAVAVHLEKADQAALSSICHTLRAGRAAFAHRLTVTGTTPAELAERLIEAARGPVGAVTPVRSVTLRLPEDGADAGPLAEAVAALVAAFPALEETVDDAPPGERLVRLLRRLGVPARPRFGGPGDRGDVRLEWRSGHDTGTHSMPLAGDSPETAPDLLLDALAQLFASGGDPRLDALRASGARLVGDLPTYPFRHVRFWIDEPAASSAGVPAADAETLDAGGTPPDSYDRESMRTYLLAVLKDVLDAPDDIDPESSLLEAGGDSFIFTLFLAKVEKHFQTGTPPEDLPLEVPMAELVELLTDHIVETTGAAPAAAGTGA
ncbi:beta-ketoacyl synthase N-terminal-like domain-containing protein [Streptosporangium sp. LJ11]|uniref:beta-ketoacyl synthase N-terminal-like domain-containing protein n=1 Tax=Streptosporangium sp. LJ11 TaxID=3436927 RepID=UPI003F7AEB1A